MSDVRKYSVTVTGNRYPIKYGVNASAYNVAVSRALRLWQKRFGKKQGNEVSITVVRGPVVVSDEDEARIEL